MKENGLLQDEIRARIEVALYCSGKPMSIDELVRASGITSREKTVRVINDLMNIINSHLRALEIAKLEDGTFVLQVKPIYLSIVRKFSHQPILSQASLKTLAYIAYEQPVTSSRLVRIRGSQVYSHLKELRSHGFVERDSLGRVKLYRTTEKFMSYFGIPNLDLLKRNLGSTRNS
ncbi:MAG TPA: SMC-Scp complex subunit ScpB [Nitrososphaeraceae archaeon]|jgi:segregation and condensation protein B|nr:SMC-Scp complex subunit ScpB [Nitrososphaeraceae archaeon]